MKVNRLIRWLPAILWMLLIYYLSGLQTTGVTGTHAISFLSIYWQRFIILKFFHLAEYSILFVLLHFALGSSPKSLLIGYLYACSDEIHQGTIVGRTAKFSDTLIDLVGLLLGFIIVKLSARFPKIKK